MPCPPSSSLPYELSYVTTPGTGRKVYEKVAASPRPQMSPSRPAYFSPALMAQEEHGAGAFDHFGPMLLPQEFSSWAEESQAHVRSCYLGDWSPLHKVVVRGPQALDFLRQLGHRPLGAFRVGQVKHHVHLDDQARVTSEGVLCRVGEQEYLYTAGSADWLLWQLSQGQWDAEAIDVSPDWCILGVQGPKSYRVLSSVSSTPLHDLDFSDSVVSEIAGVPVRVLRTGISGELGYEVHGRSDNAALLWAHLRAAGAEHDIVELGLRSQSVQHIEAGIATNGLDYLTAAAITPGASTQFRHRAQSGSFVAASVSDYFRRPEELGWGPRKTPQHDFTGRAALLLRAEGAPGVQEARGAQASRTLMGLRWNADDVATIVTAGFADGLLPDVLELPRVNGFSLDRVLLNGRDVGVSSGRTLSLTLRSTISLAVLDANVASEGRPLEVLWGREGSSQRRIRATVTSLPFKPDRRRTDVRVDG